MRTFALLVACLLFAVPCQARIITVDDDGPADFNNIQAAIDDSNNGDTIQVQPGTYTGDGNRDIDFKGKAITVRSTDPNDPNVVATTIIDCNGSESEPHRGFYFHSGEDVNSILAGFTITKGYAYFGGYDFYGGGILIEGSGPTVTNCTFNDNTAAGGGGIATGGTGNPKITKCTFISNTANDSGGGVFLGFNYSTVNNCTFISNRASFGGGGMIIVHNNSAVANCIFYGNTTSGYTPVGGGGAMLLLSFCQATVTNCTFSKNTSPWGGGLKLYEDDSTITNCIFWEDGVAMSSFRGAINYSASSYNQFGGIGNIIADPCFADPNNGDYHLKSEGGRWNPAKQRWVYDEVTSLCIDAGDPNSSVGLEPNPNGSRINMGAYGGTIEASKSYCANPIDGDINGDCVVDWKDFAIMASHWLEDNR